MQWFHLKTLFALAAVATANASAQSIARNAEPSTLPTNTVPQSHITAISPNSHPQSVQHSENSVLAKPLPTPNAFENRYNNEPMLMLFPFTDGSGMNFNQQREPNKAQQPNVHTFNGIRHPVTATNPAHVGRDSSASPSLPAGHNAVPMPSVATHIGQLPNNAHGPVIRATSPGPAAGQPNMPAKNMPRGNRPAGKKLCCCCCPCCCCCCPCCCCKCCCCKCCCCCCPCCCGCGCC
ncbi:hypothetical protein BX667DRAFT_498733 [Coemansia mojavensis]|nr:hypothetical protein BX667DRAFT_498733 [Coemansia mojavensis]